jgi:hypothetical protein
MCAGCPVDTVVWRNATMVETTANAQRGDAPLDHRHPISCPPPPASNNPRNPRSPASLGPRRRITAKSDTAQPRDSLGMVPGDPARSCDYGKILIGST